MVEFIDMYRNNKLDGGPRWGVEPICKVLTEEAGITISPSGYYDFKGRPLSRRALRDKELQAVILGIWDDNYCCWGAKKVWRELHRRGIDAARCTVERLMGEIGIYGAVRGKVKHTTIAGKNAKRAEDLVKRVFWAPCPNLIWVADFTYVSTWEGWCYTAFVTDVFARRIIGWAVSSRMNQQLVASAFKMAVYARKNEGSGDFSSLTCHHDAGSQYTSDDFVALLALHGVKDSVGSVGDAYDNALAENLHGSYKTELIKNPAMGRPWKSLEQLELATARWVYWHNNKNITEYNNWHTPAEMEDKYYTSGIDAHKNVSKASA
ncbi:MAG: IS3 family transposase [Coriobacteriales bacterium]|jgi:putative transposase|nr:IS3 family transposase [Coriobacteriales bacterium]